MTQGRDKSAGVCGGSPEFTRRSATVAESDLSAVGVVIPTRNAMGTWRSLVEGLKQQQIPPERILIIDSSSTDGTCEMAHAAGFQVHRIDVHDFNHGGTRQLAVQLLAWATVLVYLTQDAILSEPKSMERLLAGFQDPTVGAAYGRQLPRHGAGAIERHARLFNYPGVSQMRDLSSRESLGIKAAFLSNSFSAFRVSALCSVGGFPSDVIMAEDALVAGRLLLDGWKVAYVAEATVVHSHNFGVWEEFLRYFDTGVYHRREPWLLENFGQPGGEGKRFALSQVRYLLSHDKARIPESILRSGLKALGYQLGLRERRLGRSICRKLSLHKSYWDGTG